MKLFWKQFFGIVGIVTASFAFFGSVLIDTSFHMSMIREQEQAVQTIGMYQYSMVTSLESLPDDYKRAGAAVEDIAAAIYRNMQGTGSVVSVFDAEQNAVYQSQSFASGMQFPLEGEQNAVQQIRQADHTYYLENMVRIKTDFGDFYLEIDQNIQHIYENRGQLYKNYQQILIAVLVITVLLSAVISRKLTAPVKRLAKSTKQLAEGDYSGRVEVSGQDEVTDLMKDFNRMAEKLENTVAELKESARRQEEFTGAFAHELKTPLTSIIGYAEALRSMPLSKEEQRSSADYIYRQGKRLENLSHKMMELITIQKQSWEMQPVDVQQLLEGVCRMVRPGLEKKDIILESEIEAGIIYGDYQLLESLLGNLIDNAGKASVAGETIAVCGRCEKGYHIVVRDEGCGIPEEEIHKIHEAFYMVDKSRARREGGAGIGMALCERILQLHHAQWEITSKVGEGTSISLWFPEGML